MVKACLLLLIAFTVASCTNWELSRRYAILSDRTDLQAPPLNVSMFTLPVPSTPSASIRSLSDHGQAALIQAIASKTETSSDLRDEVNKFFAGPEPRNKDHSKIARRIVVSVLDEMDGLQPADRIEDLKIKIVPDEGAVKFTSWDRFITKYEEVDLGRITRNDTFTTEGSLTAGIPGLPAPAAAGPGSALASGTATVTSVEGIIEEQNLRRRYIALGGRITPGELTLVMEGVTGIDLTGTFIVDVQMDVSSDFLRTVFSVDLKDGRPEVRRSVERFPAGRCQVTATLEGSYIVRKVLAGARTNQEGDDTIARLKGTFSVENAVLIPSLGVNVSEIGGDESRILSIKTSESIGFESMYFKSIGDANLLYDWLLKEVGEGRAVDLGNDVKVSIKSAAPNNDGNPIKADNINTIKPRLASLNCV